MCPSLVPENSKYAHYPITRAAGDEIVGPRLRFKLAKCDILFINSSSSFFFLKSLVRLSTSARCMIYKNLLLCLRTYRT